MIFVDAPLNSPAHVDIFIGSRNMYVALINMVELLTRVKA